MAYQAVPNTIQVMVRGSLAGQSMQNDFYYEHPLALTQAKVDAVTDAVDSYWNNNMLGLLPIAWTGTETYGRALDHATDFQSTSLINAGIAGQINSPPLPSLATVAIARRSAYTGRNGRGRVFWMGLTEADVSANTVSSTLTGNIADALAAMDSYLLTLGYTGVIVSRIVDGVKLTTGQTFPIVQWLAVDNEVDTRRSRKPTA